MPLNESSPELWTETGPVTRFRGEHLFLSNFYPCKVTYDIFCYETVEAAYQAAKTLDASERRLIREASNPYLAKRLGRKVELRSDWAGIKRRVMADLLWQKFMLHPELRDKLLETGERELVEGGAGDIYWGVDNTGFGENYLGRMLMAIRAVIRLAVVKADGRTASK